MLSSLPRRNNSSLAQCGCKKHGMDLHSDHTSTCTAPSGATKAHDCMVSALGPLFRWPHGPHFATLQRVCVYYCSTYCKAVRVGEGILEGPGPGDSENRDMC